MTKTEHMQNAGLSALRRHDLEYVIGVDEVGYGAWAGPVVVCACVVSAKWSDGRINDSKKMTPLSRAKAVDEILVEPTIRFHKLWAVSAAEIDNMGIIKARDLAVRRAVDACIAFGREDFQSIGNFYNWLVVMDGDKAIAGLPTNTIFFPKADDLVPAVSAASVLAKVARDKIMKGFDLKYPGYGFATNVGYGTEKHMRGIEDHGLTPIHRRSYKPIKDYARLHEEK